MTSEAAPISDLAAMVRELSDRELIRQLPARYCHYVRTRNVAAILDLYAPDGVFDLPANMAEGGAREGRDAIAETFRNNLERMDPWPFTHNHVIEFEGADQARGFVYTEFRIGAERMRVGFVGVYEDVYTRLGDTWKFQSRKLTAITIGDTETSTSRQST